jgi:hypothetical protein
MRFLIVLVLLSHIAFAGQPALAPHKGKDVTVSFPKGWTITEQDGVYVAQQDPKKKDAAGLLFVYIPNPNNQTEEALLAAMTASVAKDLKVIKKEAIDGGVGHLLIADGTSEGIKMRLAAIAVVASGKAIVCVMVAKPSEFDGLGGMNLVASVLKSLVPDQAAAPPATTTTAQPAAAGKLTVGAPDHAIKVGELAGEWTQDDHVMTSYVSSSTGSYGGYSSVATSEKWTIDGKGNMSSKFNATSSSSRSGTYQISENTAAVITIDGDTLTITPAKGKGSVSHYLLRGWEQRPDVTVLKINGPYYDKGVEDIDHLRRDPAYARNLDKFWVRVTKK